MVRRCGRAAWTMQGQLASGVTPQKDDSGLGLDVRRHETTTSQCGDCDSVRHKSDVHLATWGHPNADHQYTRHNSGL